jgi:hypothetical protein
MPTDVIEGEFRVVATRDLPPARPSPKRRRAVFRIVFWHSAVLIGLVASPLLHG